MNGKKYVGKTVARLRKRWSNHVHSARNGSFYYLHRAMRKYGIENFKIEEVCRPPSYELLSALEKWYIGFYKSNDSKFGYNLTTGGEGTVGYKFSEEQLKKLSLSHLGQSRLHSEETKRKMSQAKMGIKLSEEHRKNLSESHKGFIPSKESIKKRADAMRGHTFTEEAKQKIRNTLLGHPVSEETREKIRKANTGRKHSKETREKMSMSHKKRVSAKS
jgi:group I intron endonuclease